MLALAASTCSGIDNVEVEAAGTTVVEGSPLGEILGPIGLSGFNSIDISQSQEFENEGYTKDQIDSVRVKRFTLTIDQPADADFDFLTRISFSVEAEGLPSVVIASLDPVPAGSNVLELELEGVNLRDYATAPSMSVTTAASGNAPDRDTTISANLVFDVDVSVSGAAGCSVATH